METKEIEKLGKPIVLLQTLWTTRDPWKQKPDPDDNVISHGIWKTTGVDETERGRFYTLLCVVSNHPKVLIGATKKMHEEMIIAICCSVSLIVHPKLSSGSLSSKLRGTNDTDFKNGDEVKIKIGKDDLENIDLGASGIVLDSFFKKFGDYIDSVFRYVGTMKENEDWCFIQYKDKFTIKEFSIRKENIQKVEVDRM